MSYILKALQRAEAERNRGVTPGLNTPVLPAVATPETSPRSVLPWGLAVGAVAGCAALAWFLWPAEPQRVAPAPAAAPAPTVAAAPPPVAQAVPPAPIVAAPPVPEPAPRRPVADGASPPVGQGRNAASPAVPPSPAPAPPAAVARTAPPALAPSATAPATAPAVALADLPPQVRQSLPALNLGGAIYSPEPANRLLIVNGQVLREKAQIAPDLVLETIGVRSAIFRFRGQRFEVRY